MTFKQFKEMMRELEFFNQGKIIDDYEVVVTKQCKKDRAISGVKIIGNSDRRNNQILIETDY